MNGDPSVSAGIIWALREAGDIAFRWVPGTVMAVTDTVSGNGPVPINQPITQPIHPSDVANFLQQTAAAGAFNELYRDWNTLVAVSILVTLLLLAFCIYCIIRLFQVHHHEEEHFRASAHPIAARDVSKTQLRWDRILVEIRSDNDQSWRLAILEADIMLSELLDVLGYKGETMADKMKQIDRSHFRSIDLAWEAHRVRNAIAHQGSMHQIGAHEARRVIGMYEQVFREFRFIE